MSNPTLRKELPAALERAENLPSLPAVAVEVLRLTEDEDSTLDELAETLGRDPALSAKLLKLSNSSLFSAGAEITTLQRATMMLGMKTVKLMSLSFSLVGTLPREGQEGEFEYSQYWRHSLVAAVVARALARRTRSREGDEAFLCGILGHFGRLVLARCLPEAYGEVLKQHGPWPSIAQEEEVLGFHSADVGSALLSQWGIPSRVHTAVAYMRCPEQAPADTDPPTREFLKLMNLASLGETVLCEHDGGTALQEMRERGRRDFGLLEPEIDEFLLGLEPNIRDTAEMLSVHFDEGHSHAGILERARMQIVNLSLGTAVDLHQERRKNAALEFETRDLRERASTDKLTGLPNRATFDEVLAEHVESRVMGPVPRALGVVMIDLDKFKSFNDTYGHQVGDEVLRMVGGILKQATRKGDLPARYGGEEFVLVTPRTTPFGLRSLSERLRAAIEGQALEVDGKRLSVTASFGAACIARFASREEGAALVKLADYFLYQAKKNGRNRCEVYPRMQFSERG
ncbi:MAG: GGDEF domain-containing protein [Planctomycetota bacterium]